MRRAKTLKAKRFLARRKLERAYVEAFRELEERMSDALMVRLFPQVEIDRLRKENERLRSLIRGTQA